MCTIQLTSCVGLSRACGIVNHCATHGHALVLGICPTADLADFTENQLLVPILTLCLELVAILLLHEKVVQLLNVMRMRTSTVSLETPPTFGKF